MIKKAKKPETLSDRIAGILTTAPSTIDPEDDIYEETTARVTNDLQDEESGEDTGLSNFRKQTVDLLEDVDQRYIGKKGSRKSLKEDDEWETEDEGLSTDEGEDLDGVSGTQHVNSDSEDGSDDSDRDDSDAKSENNEIEANFQHISETNETNQLKKGKCVRNQLNLWENLLETRIQIQKCVINSNKLPQFDNFEQFITEKEFKSSMSKTTNVLTETLDKLLNLQQLLLKQFTETKQLLKIDKTETKVESDEEEIASDSDSDTSQKRPKTEEPDSETDPTPKKRQKLDDYEDEIRNRHQKYSEYRNTVIQKWNEKTRVSVQKSQNQSSILQHISYILSDKPKLIRRTQIKRSDYQIIGKLKAEPPEQNPDNPDLKAPEDVDPEIFDDDDFYHQLLRELIEFKSAGITDPVQMSRQWIQLQNLRSKMKRKIDTKATKGRKIRYAVHSKLVNFMASIDNRLWTEEAKNELYASVFGNNKFNKK